MTVSHIAIQARMAFGQTTAAAPSRLNRRVVRVTKPGRTVRVEAIRGFSDCGADLAKEAFLRLLAAGLVGNSRTASRMRRLSGRKPFYVMAYLTFDNTPHDPDTDEFVETLSIDLVPYCSEDRLPRADEAALVPVHGPAVALPEHVPAKEKLYQKRLKKAVDTLADIDPGDVPEMYEGTPEEEVMPSTPTDENGLAIPSRPAWSFP